nr:MAG TPA: Protein of unknown function (DUF2680) [Caudoviricetes sp.]
MPNPLYNEMQKNTPNQLETVFERFMNQFKGQNPTAIINQMVQSGQISQAQLNVAQDRARQLSSMFEGLREKFNL